MAKIIDKNYNSVIANLPSMFSSPSKKDKSKRKSKTSKGMFSQFLKEELVDNLLETSENESVDKQNYLVKLQDDVYSAGDFLKNKMTPEAIVNYKRAVKNFVNYVVDNAFDYKKAPDRMTSFRKPKSSAIRVIDQKLEKFATELLSNQLSQLMIMERLDEIKGLLIDLLG